MEQHQEQNHNRSSWASAGARPNRWLVVAVVALLGVAGVAFAYGYHQQSMVHQLTMQATASNAATNQMQSQVDALTAKLNEMAAAQASAASAPPAAAPASPAATEVSAKTAETPATSATPAKSSAAKRATSKRRAPLDKRYVQLQAQLAEQQKQLKETQEQVTRNRAELEGDLNSTRDDLNGSIAKTHEELVALAKRGERSYFEFDLSKSKQFQRIGPLTLSLRKADTKHKSYDLAMIVDDNELNKKKVNLYEPIWIHTETESQPVQIVVNKIEKNVIHGYISAPKYKPSELAAASVTPVSAKSPTATPNPQPPQQPQQ